MNRHPEYLKKQHGLRLLEARRCYGTARICPDCYLPADRCQHVHEWAFLRRPMKRG